MNANTHISSDSLHRDPDHTIDRALSALRDAAPRPGLEGRVLSSLEHRATEPGGLTFGKAKRWGIARGSARGNLGGSAHIALWTAASAVILAVASMTILHYRVMRAKNAVILSEAHRAESKNPETVIGAINPEPFSTTNPAPLTQTASSRPERHSLAAMRSAETCISDHLGCPAHEDRDATPTDAQLLVDLRAPSHPAPPLPLTPQERLFVHILRYGNLTELAELDPMVRAKHDADETAAFKAFFPDPPPLKPTGDTE